MFNWFQPIIDFLLEHYPLFLAILALGFLPYQWFVELLKALYGMFVKKYKEEMTVEKLLQTLTNIYNNAPNIVKVAFGVWAMLCGKTTEEMLGRIAQWWYDHAKWPEWKAAAEGTEPPIDSQRVYPYCIKGDRVRRCYFLVIHTHFEGTAKRDYYGKHWVISITATHKFWVFTWTDTYKGKLDRSYG